MRYKIQDTRYKIQDTRYKISFVQGVEGYVLYKFSIKWFKNHFIAPKVRRELYETK